MGVFPWRMNSRSCANYIVKVSKCFDVASKTKEASIDDTRRVLARHAGLSNVSHLMIFFRMCDILSHVPTQQVSIRKLS